LFVLIVLAAFEISESIYEFELIVLIVLFTLSVQITLEFKKWLFERSRTFFNRKNFFIFSGLLILDAALLIVSFYLSPEEIIYQSNVFLIFWDMILSTALSLIFIAAIPLVYLTIRMLIGPPKSSSIRVSKRKLILIPVYSILGLIGFFVAVLLIGWGLYTSQEFVSGIYWDKYFCGPSKIEKATGGIVRVETESGIGTGFWIADDLILTNNHVVIFDENINVVARDATYYAADVVQTDTIKDIAILRITKTTDYEQPKVLKWRKRWPVLAEDVFALGFPEGTKDITATKGIVSSLTSDEFDSTKYIQTDAAINNGNSGGPLVDICGKVLGISSSTLLDAENIGFAIDGSRVRDQIEEMIIASREISPEEIKRGQTGGEAETVIRYYLMVSRGDFEDAYDFYSEDLKKRVLFKGWKESYENTFAIRFKSARRTAPGIVEVIFRTVDFPEKESEDFTAKEFIGTWSLVKENGLWKLNYSNIKEVPLDDEF